MDTKIKLLILSLFSAFTTFAQTPGINFAAKFNITSATGGDPYNITGIVLDDLSRFTGSDVQVNDSIYVIDGDQLYVLAVTSITSVVGPTVTLVANDPNNAGVSIPTGQAAICRPTDNYKLPLYISGLRDDLRSMVMNRQAQLIDDINGSAVSAITDFTSAGVNVPPSPAASLNGGETWRNMTTGELWGSDGNVWYPYTRGPKECQDTVLVSAITVQSGGSVTTGSPLIRNSSGVWEHMYNHPSGLNLIPDGVVTDIIVGGKAIVQYCGVRKGSGATPNTSYYVNQSISTGFTTTKPTTDIRPLGKVANNGDFLINAGLLFSRDNGGSTSPLTVLVSGQSNAWGATAPFQGDTTSSASVTVWNGSSFIRAQIGVAPFRVFANNPSSHVYDNSNNFALHFCKKLAEESGRPVRLIINVADGNAINTWVPGTAANFVALQSTIAAASVTKVDVFLWHQGEADNANSTNYYRLKFDTLKQQLRSQTWFPAATPIIVGGLLPNSGYSSQDATLASFNYSYDPWVACANAEGLTNNGIDVVHYAGASLVILGKERYWAAYRSLPKLPTAPAQLIGSRPEQLVASFAPPSKGSQQSNFNFGINNPPQSGFDGSNTMNIGWNIKPDGTKEDVGKPSIGLSYTQNVRGLGTKAYWERLIYYPSYSATERTLRSVVVAENTSGANTITARQMADIWALRDTTEKTYFQISGSQSPSNRFCNFELLAGLESTTFSRITVNIDSVSNTASFQNTSAASRKATSTFNLSGYHYFNLYDEAAHNIMSYTNNTTYVLQTFGSTSLPFYRFFYTQNGTAGWGSHFNTDANTATSLNSRGNIFIESGSNTSVLGQRSDINLGYIGTSGAFAIRSTALQVGPNAGASLPLGVTLQVNSNLANTSALFRLQTTTDSVKYFVTSVNPNSVITGRVGDIANGSNGTTYIKKTGNNTNTGWEALVSTSGTSTSISTMMREESFTSTSGQTAFTIAYSAPAVSGTSVPIRVYRNGVRLFYVASGPTITQFTYSGTTVTTLANTAGDIITIEYLN